MVTIEEGPELDRAVAEAVSNTGNPHPEGYMGPALSIPFLPSIDLNAAFAAAEKVWKEFALKRRPSGQWELTAFCAGDDGWSRFEDEATPALAICAAILKPKG